MEDTNVLQEKLKCYQRCLDNPDVQEMLDDLDELFHLNAGQQNVQMILNSGQNHEFVLVKEGLRLYSMTARSLVSQTEKALEDAKQGEKEDE